MKNKLNLKFMIYILIILLSLYFPILDMFIFKINFYPLLGAVKSTQFPEFEIKSIFEGEFQKKIEKWFVENFGYKPFFVRLENSINYFFFHESLNKSNQVLIGNNDFLFGKQYIKSFNQRSTNKHINFDPFASNLKKFSEIMEKEKKGFTFLISPSKASIYEEYIPKNWVLFENYENIDINYEDLITSLNKFSVHYIDSVKLFKKWKAENPKIHWFPKGGTHWSYYGACKVLNEIFILIQSKLQRNIGNISCEIGNENQEAQGTDRDIADILNMWNISRFIMNTPYPKIQLYQKIKNSENVLFIGTSFLDTLASILSAQNYLYKANNYTYLKSSIVFPTGVQEPLDLSQINWKNDLSERSIVILELNESMLSYDYLNRFFDFYFKSLQSE